MAIEQLGPYRIERTLGRGGMGTVYAGVDEKTGQKAAIKMLAAALTDHEHFRERFAAEIETLKKLTHPRIVQLYGYGEEEGQLFYSMELVEGHNLQEEISAGRRFGWREIVRLGIDVCQALKCAHDRGVIHRDLKPANLLLDKEERVKLTDFGIAKLFGTSRMTADGGVLGTADYMAPEQAEGAAVTHRCDLFALGCVLYTLLVGHPPHAADTLPEVLHKLKYEQPPPVARYSPDAPAELHQVVTLLLRKDPTDRIPTAQAVMKRLKAIEQEFSMDSAGQEPHTLGFDLPDVDRETGNPLRTPDPGETRDLPPELLAEYANSSAGQPDPSSGDTPAEAEVEESPGDTPASQSATTSHFTTVEKKAPPPKVAPPITTEPWPRWLKATLFAGTMALAIFLVFLAFRPPSRSTTWNRLQEKVAVNDVKSLAAAEDDLRRFLQRFPQGEDSLQAAEWLSVLEEDRRLNELERKPNTWAGAELSAVERTYLESVRLAETEPEEGLARLQSFVETYEHLDAHHPVVIRTVARARDHIQLLSSQLQEQHQQDRREARRLLEQAGELAEDDREAAQSVYEGIIALYGEKPWVEDIVGEARQKLAEL